MLKTEPTKRWTLTLCKIIEEDFRDPKILSLTSKLKGKASQWDRRDHQKYKD